MPHLLKVHHAERMEARELGDARTELNIGAGIGSYEPIDRDVTAEPRVRSGTPG